MVAPAVLVVPGVAPWALGNVILVGSAVLAVAQSCLVALLITEHADKRWLRVRVTVRRVTEGLCWASGRIRELVEWVGLWGVGVLEKELEAPLVWKLVFKLVLLAPVYVVYDLFVSIQDTEWMGLFTKILMIFAFKDSRRRFLTDLAFKLFNRLIFARSIYDCLKIHIHWRSYLIGIGKTKCAYWMNILLAPKELFHISTPILAFNTPNIR